MGVWHTLLLAGSYLTVVRLGRDQRDGARAALRPRERGRGAGPPHRGDRPGLERRLERRRGASPSCVPARAGSPGRPGGSGSSRWRSSARRTCTSPTSRPRSGRTPTSRCSRASTTCRRPLALLMPVVVYALGFPGLCLHAAAAVARRDRLRPRAAPAPRRATARAAGRARARRHGAAALRRRLPPARRHRLRPGDPAAPRRRAAVGLLRPRRGRARPRSASCPGPSPPTSTRA